MRIGLPLFVILSGLVLVVVDRVVDKEKVLRLDKHLSQFVFFNRKKLLLLFGLPLPFLFYQTVRTSPSFTSIGLLVLLILGILILGIISWIIFGGLIAYHSSKGSDNHYRWVLISIFALGTPIIVVGFVLIFLLRSTLFFLIYPPKGFSLSKANWFKSFFGLVGMVLIGIGMTYIILALVSNIQLDTKLIVVLDWLGSSLMLGTIWAWIYHKVSHPIKERLTKADRRLKALERLVKIRYGDAMENDDKPNVKDPLMRRFRTYRYKRGIHSRMPLLERAHLLNSPADVENTHTLDEVTRQQYEEAQQYKKDQSQLFALAVRLLFGFWRQQARRYLMTIVDRFTYSVFSGALGVILFVVGFVLWNLSKLLSLYIP